MRCEVINVEAGIHGCFDIGDTIRQSKSNFLYGSGACFADMITGNTDRVPMGNLLFTEFEYIGD